MPGAHGSAPDPRFFRPGREPRRRGISGFFCSTFILIVCSIKTIPGAVTRLLQADDGLRGRKALHTASIPNQQKEARGAVPRASFLSGVPFGGPGAGLWPGGRPGCMIRARRAGSAAWAADPGVGPGMGPGKWCVGHNALTYSGLIRPGVGPGKWCVGPGMWRRRGAGDVARAWGPGVRRGPGCGAGQAVRWARACARGAFGASGSGLRTGRAVRAGGGRAARAPARGRAQSWRGAPPRAGRRLRRPSAVYSATPAQMSRKVTMCAGLKGSR